MGGTSQPRVQKKKKTFLSSCLVSHSLTNQTHLHTLSPSSLCCAQTIHLHHHHHHHHRSVHLTPSNTTNTTRMLFCLSTTPVNQHTTHHSIHIPTRKRVMCEWSVCSSVRSSVQERERERGRGDTTNIHQAHRETQNTTVHTRVCVLQVQYLERWEKKNVANSTSAIDLRSVAPPHTLGSLRSDTLIIEATHNSAPQHRRFIIRKNRRTCSVCIITHRTSQKKTTGRGRNI